ncbi:epoxyqueuosine reductase QueH [Campylobacter suis]|uniref:Epoxyqueuosine reductase QueH n=1 Tax=Campylobacter suis TaxID=2790657 RepID=A0ABM8Q799_9BACT|nr:epoxyqueuosine reductase QueH [Campylobacter suis]CAD7288668.1 Epoxyqueuosine reductase QueH [Campylobacter suis]
MLVHICCSVDSHYFLQRLRKELPDEPLLGYFYDPNIHPYSEYLMRYEDVKRSCDKLGIELLMGEYEYESWLAGTKGLEDEPEKGKRCAYCFDFRVGNSAKKAVELGHKSITTTLLMSPKKDFTQLTNALKRAVDGTDLEIFAVDFRAGGGTNEQFELAKNDKLYHQNYCGCIFGLSKQRQAQGLPLAELMSDVNARVLPGSIEERLALYANVRECESKGLKFELFRRQFLNYRLLRGLVKFDGKAVPSYFVFYSNFKRKSIKISLKTNEQIATNLRDGVILLSLTKLNELMKTSFKSVDELCKSEFSLDFELALRAKISGAMSLNPIIVLESVLAGKYEIIASSELYHDSCEVLELD